MNYDSNRLLVVLTPKGPSKVAEFDAATGKKRWEVPLPDAAKASTEEDGTTLTAKYVDGVPVVVEAPRAGMAAVTLFNKDSGTTEKTLTTPVQADEDVVLAGEGVAFRTVTTGTHTFHRLDTATKALVSVPKGTAPNQFCGEGKPKCTLNTWPIAYTHGAPITTKTTSAPDGVDTGNITCVDPGEPAMHKTTPLCQGFVAGKGWDATGSAFGDDPNAQVGLKYLTPRWGILGGNNKMSVLNLSTGKTTPPQPNPCIQGAYPLTSPPDQAVESPNGRYVATPDLTVDTATGRAVCFSSRIGFTPNVITDQGVALGAKPDGSDTFAMTTGNAENPLKAAPSAPRALLRDGSGVFLYEVGDDDVLAVLPKK